MTEGATEMRDEASDHAPWESLSEPVFVHELETPTVAGTLARAEEVAGCLYFDRMVVLVRVSGGMLVASPRRLVTELAGAGARLRQRHESPALHLRATVSWLEEEQRDGLLRRSYSTASILIVVSSDEVWSWHVGPHGTFSGTIESVSFRSTDARIPVLYEHGASRPAFRAEDSELRDRASSVFAIGTPAGYECTRQELDADSLVVEADRGALPFGPLDRTWPFPELWEQDAAWRHGLPGRALVVGRRPRLDVPTGWEIRTSELRDPAPYRT
jgi:hypothetical protein